jgi:two-component system nitrogen regulation response regulator NtrX
MVKEHLLVVDDEKSICISLQRILEDEEYCVTIVESAESALDVMKVENIDLLLLDVWLPGMDGLAALSQIRENWTGVPVIMISGHGTIETAVSATKLGAYDFIEKPLSLNKVILSVEHALRQKNLEDENRVLRQKVEQEYRMIGNSSAVYRLKELIAAAAPSNSRVLISGESGTGKELVARDIHYKSLRSDGRFVEVNCAAIPEELIESELFGHEKGSFTGAATRRKGKFEIADKGTLFLDEVGDMSLKTQAKVLRVLEEEAIQRVGGTQLIEIDARITAASNKNLEEEIKKGAFREDLFYRLNVIPIFVPPLRERIDDISLLVDFFLEDFCAKNGKKKKSIDPVAVESLCSYHWPGNIRELKNLIERLVIMVPSDSVTLDDLPQPFMIPERAGHSFDCHFSSLREARNAFEKEHINRLLERNNWNISKTATELKIGRNNLYSKMRAYKLIQPDQTG